MYKKMTAYASIADPKGDATAIKIQKLAKLINKEVIVRTGLSDSVNMARVKSDLAFTVEEQDRVGRGIITDVLISGIPTARFTDIDVPYSLRTVTLVVDITTFEVLHDRLQDVRLNHLYTWSLGSENPVIDTITPLFFTCPAIDRAALQSALTTTAFC